MDTPPISELRNALDRVADEPVPFWWRDDDAASPTQELERLATIAADHAFPCALAVIPQQTGEELARWMENHPLLSVIQHGYAHVNHAPRGSGAWELGAHRPAPVVMAEMVRGRQTLAALFGDRFVPVMVPPWNHVDASLVPLLPMAGFRGLSADAEGPAQPTTQGLRQADAHADFLRWKKKSARFAGEHKIVQPIIQEMERQRQSGKTAPVGILTHHLEMDEAAWSFLETLLDMLTRHPAAQPVSAAHIWQESL